jgi:hypothetical protein
VLPLAPRKRRSQLARVSRRRPSLVHPGQ